MLRLGPQGDALDVLAGAPTRLYAGNQDFAYNRLVVFERQAESVHTLYAELVDQCVQAAAAQVTMGLPARGSFVSKAIKGRTYWYFQRMEAGRKKQHYLGPDSPSLHRWIDEMKIARGDHSADRDRRAELVAMLVSGGSRRESAPVTKVLDSLADVGVFQRGAVLVGTQAFNSYANMLGVRFERDASRTQDVDLAQDPEVSLALDPDRVPSAVERALRDADPRFLAVPALDPRHPSTSYKVRGRDLRVDFLTPAKGRKGGEPVFLPMFQVAALPVAFLDYLMEAPEQAVVLGGSGVLVNVPHPARFALHKIWTSRRRSATEQAKAAKDLRQAESLLEVLLEDRRDDLRAAWRAVAGRTRRQVILDGLRSLAPGTAEAFEGLLSS